MNQISNSAVIHSNVVIGENVVIEDYCVIGGHADPLDPKQRVFIGSGSHIRSHSVIYSGVELGSGVSTGHHVVVRSNVTLKEGVSVGSYSSVDEDVTIGDYSRIHGYTQIGKGSTIGKFCWIYSLVTLMNDPLPPSHIATPVQIGDMVTVAVNSQIMPGMVLNDGAFISASSLVAQDVPAGYVVSGNPAQIVGRVKHLTNLDTGISHPWANHFVDFYPESVHNRIKEMSHMIYGGGEK